MPGPSGIGDVEVDAFVDANVVSFVAWDLVAYLSQHPDEARTVAEYAHLLSRPEADVQAVVRRLVGTGLLDEAGTGDESLYRLTRDPAAREVMGRFIELSTRRDRRLEFVRRVLGQVATG